MVLLWWNYATLLEHFLNGIDTYASAALDKLTLCKNKKFLSFLFAAPYTPTSRKAENLKGKNFLVLPPPPLCPHTCNIPQYCDTLQ